MYSSVFRSNMMRSNSRRDLTNLMTNFQKQLTATYETSHRIPVCAIFQASYYEILLDSFVCFHWLLLFIANGYFMSLDTLISIASLYCLPYIDFIWLNGIALASSHVAPALSSLCIRLEKHSTAFASNEIIEIFRDDQLLSRYDSFVDNTTISVNFCYDTYLFLTTVMRLRSE